ncbi:AdoMet_MTases domain containing protein [uncultured Caudovirales phage]|uniref:AdoMet_MTases domain containing protein n=1 Tax=uncultured Caudovirales phage TaxID=2100421 RepID=A0A6J5KT09_9CAUD|nr:AdoMet_MTases domain containing protein [uncultured Caudovirales phage]
MFDMLIVLQSHSKSSARTDERFCKADKLEVSTRCFKSLINTINWCQQKEPSVNYRLIVADDHSDQEFLDTVHQAIKTSSFSIKLENLETRGIMPSILRTYEIGKEHGRDLVYFAQDDYLFYETALWEMIDAYVQFKDKTKEEVCIFPYDHPLRYELLADKNYFYKILLGANRHWRVAYHTACCFFMNHSTIVKEWDLFEAMGNHAYDEICEDETINRLFSERNYLLFTPIPSVALHMGMWSDWDRYINWRELWNKFPYQSKYKLPENVKTVLNVGSGGCAVKVSPLSNGLESYKEITVDLDDKIHPDIFTDMKDLSMIENNSVDAVYSCHSLEHVHFHQVKLCLEEWYRVIKVGGEVRILVPNLKEISGYLKSGGILDKVYDSSGGPISAIDMLYGYRKYIANGNEYMAHKTGFTKESAETICASLGMSCQVSEEDGINLLIRIFKPFLD